MYLTIVAGSNWLMTLEFDEDYSDDYLELAYKIENSMGGGVVYENEGIESEFLVASDLTELMESYDLWNPEPDPVPKSRKAAKAWAKDEYEIGFAEFSRPDGSIGKLALHAQISSKVKPVLVEIPSNHLATRVFGSGWMMTVVGEKRDIAFIHRYIEEVKEYLGCESE
jgi:hypothetical protein